MMTELLQAVKAVRPSQGNVFVGLGENRYPSYVIPEFVIPEALGTFLENTKQILTPKMVDNNLAWYHYRPIMDNPEAIWQDFYRGDLFNLVWRPYNQYHCLQGLIRSNGVEGGFLHVFRPSTQLPFSESEKTLFKQILPYIEHGWQSHRVEESHHNSASTESGMFIMDNAGGLVFASDTARHLLTLAQHPVYNIGQAHTVGKLTIPPELERLCRSLNTLLKGREAPPPISTLSNPLGHFTFRAHSLEKLGEESGRLTGVTVDYREPVALKLWRRIKEMSLSPTQREVCLMLGQNYPRDMIAQRLHIKPTTLKDHIRKIYEKLEVRSHEELIGRLENNYVLPQRKLF
jgi:DNA-binding CsgD family transcriptional regulator